LYNSYFSKLLEFVLSVPRVHGYKRLAILLSAILAQNI